MPPDDHDLADLRVLLESLSGEISLGEERLQNKVSTEVYLRDTIATAAETNKQIAILHTRINGLYIKVAGASGVIVALVELAFRMSR